MSMTVHTEQTTNNIVLQKACLFFGKPGGETETMTLNDIEIVKGIPVIKEGKLVSRQSIKKMMDSVLKTNKAELSFIPEHVLAANDDSIVWWAPAKERRIFFSTNSQPLEKRSGIVHNPSLVFAIIDGHWKVFAIDGNSRPTLNTALKCSPYYNVWDSHTICVGSTRKPNDRLAVDEWTKAFFDSAFTHENYRSQKSEMKYEGGRTQLWADLLDGKLENFPTEILPNANLTLGQLLKAKTQ